MISLNFYFKNFLTEFKFKIYYSFLTLILTTISIYINIYPILYLLSKYLLQNISSSKFFFSNIIQIFFLYLEISLWISLILTLPFILINFLQYFIPSLYLEEIFFFCKSIFLSFLLFFFSIFFTNFYTIPQCLTFFLNFENSNQFFPIFFEAKIDEYFLFIINIFFKSIFFFQIPVLCYILIKLNLIKKNFFTNNRKFVHIFFLIITAAISPPEIMVQILLWFWFIFLFEILIFINIFLKNIKKRNKSFYLNSLN